MTVFIGVVPTDQAPDQSQNGQSDEFNLFPAMRMYENRGDDQPEKAPPAEGLADAADVLPDYLNESDTGCDHPQVDVELLADAAAQIHNNLYEQISDAAPIDHHSENWQEQVEAAGLHSNPMYTTNQDASTKQDPPADWKAKVEAAGLCPNPMYASRKEKPPREDWRDQVNRTGLCANPMYGKSGKRQRKDSDETS
ncbi:uncharacterized protein LOC144861168 [Branchiostoma floridae x Branchiostoma japonicum]